MPEYISTRKYEEILNQSVPEEFTPEQRAEFGKSLQTAFVARGFELEGVNSKFEPKNIGPNIPKNAVDFVTFMWYAGTHPGQTLQSADSIIKGLVRKTAKATGLLSDEDFGTIGKGGSSEQDEMYLDATIDYFADRYGSLDRFLNTLEREPLFFLHN